MLWRSVRRVERGVGVWVGSGELEAAAAMLCMMASVAELVVVMSADEVARQAADEMRPRMLVRWRVTCVESRESG